MLLLTKVLFACLLMNHLSDGVFGKPEPQIVTALVTSGVLAGGASLTNAFKCSNGRGCHKGYCWAWCGADLSSGDWCYTTRSHSQSFDYVKCSRDGQCDNCWKCAGSCTL